MCTAAVGLDYVLLSWKFNKLSFYRRSSLLTIPSIRGCSEMLSAVVNALSDGAEARERCDRQPQYQCPYILENNSEGFIGRWGAGAI